MRRAQEGKGESLVLVKHVYRLFIERPLADDALECILNMAAKPKQVHVQLASCLPGGTSLGA